MTKPDFKTWAENIVLLAQAHGTAREEVEKALEQAYDQGYHLGLNNGWAIEQDKEYRTIKSAPKEGNIPREKISKAVKKVLENLKEEFPHGFYHGNMCVCSSCMGDPE